MVLAEDFDWWHEDLYKGTVLEAVLTKSFEKQVICMTIDALIVRLQQGDIPTRWCFEKREPQIWKKRKLLVIGEASQIWELTAVMLLSLLNWFDRLVIAGDSKQLQPYVARRHSAGSIMTWASRLRYKIPCTKLLIQYRMVPAVGSMVSQLFYDGTLVNAMPEDGKKHIFFHDVGGTTIPRGTSCYNPKETEVCLQIYRKLQTRGNLEAQILTFYKAQELHIKHRCKEAKVCCVDSYQGQEVQAVVLSLTVRKGAVYSFLSQAERICVSISRAKYFLHIVGCKRTMIQNDVWARIIQRCSIIKH